MLTWKRWAKLSIGGRTWGCLLFLIVFPSILEATVTIDDPGRYVVDIAGIIDDGSEQKLEGWLRELEQKTTAQVKVLTVATTEGEDIFSFVQRQAEHWKLGQAKKDNGALIALAVKERKVRVQTGYGLEAILPDAWIGSASRDVAGQEFKQGKYTEGIAKLTVAVAHKIADAENIQLTGLPQYRYEPRPQRKGASLISGLLPFLIFAFILSGMSRRRDHYHRWGGTDAGVLPGLLLGSLMGGRRSGWGGGGGGFGGSFGGGNFGGGGRFGGGGGGASW